MWEVRILKTSKREVYAKIPPVALTVNRLKTKIVFCSKYAVPHEKVVNWVYA